MRVLFIHKLDHLKIMCQFEPVSYTRTILIISFLLLKFNTRNGLKFYIQSLCRLNFHPWTQEQVCAEKTGFRLFFFFLIKPKNVYSSFFSGVEVCGASAQN